MAIIKCKMCGGDLVIEPGSTVAECEYCGSRQTVPTADNEKKLTLFARANRLRSGCEFDKAAGVYESIVADFPQEAEAYWGLVLCKYGIEYVDDPATGKKIPTCHRSSFDSILEDSDFDQACENADTVAQKVYREEAKEFERIRKGILEVSSTEKPYDIFICYKETDEKGERTLDSVLAQDLYTALTDKGYRVFFSRVTLRDKLGQAYEPYIFAALNSAKVMLAVGTCYEYYNAVWVKNEWSRYLKLMAADKSKHLIPCYKDLDPEDMPKEFKHLQGADLGKMGSIQDILFNMEKYIPLKKQTVVQERVVVENAGSAGKIASLLQRGYMALEDGDWNKADGFFEEVLNNDFQNAQAYIGKALVKERQKTLDGLVRQWLQSTENTKPETLSLKPEEAHIEKAVQDYTIAGYLEPDDIRKAYHFDLSYPSTVPGREQQYQQTKSRWENHQWLSKAEKFASEAVAQTLQDAKTQLIACLADRVRQAESAEKNDADKLRSEYAAHIIQADAQAEKKYQNGLDRRETDYRSWLAKAKTETDPKTLQELASRFDSLGDFQDSRNLAEYCRKRSDEERAQIDAENKRQRMAAEQERKARQKKNITLAILAATVVIVVIIASVFVSRVIIPGNQYKAAEVLLLNRQYEEAIAAFEALGNFRDSVERMAQAQTLRQAEIDAEIEAQNARLYADAESLLSQGKKVEAAMAFGAIDEYRDAIQRSMALWNEIAKRDTISAGRYVTLGVNSDGSAFAAWDDDYKPKYYFLFATSDVIAVAAGFDHAVALKSDGTVYADSRSSWMDCCAVSDWKNIVAISADYYCTAGIRADGTVVAVGCDDEILQEISTWKNIIDVSVDRDCIVGLHPDGTVVVAADSDDARLGASRWTDIVDISMGGYHVVGLKADGTVVAQGWESDGQCSVSDWHDIVQVSAGTYHTIGLKSDGTVVATGESDNDQCSVSGWQDIVAVSAGGYHTVGLRSDGTAVAVGGRRDSESGRCNVSAWKNIQLP